MNDFKRGQSTKKSLEIGNVVFYRKKWKYEMTEALYALIPDFAAEMAIEYNYFKMNFESGFSDFFSISMDQKEERVFTIALEDFIVELKKIEKLNKEQPF